MEASALTTPSQQYQLSASRVDPVTQVLPQVLSYLSAKEAARLSLSNKSWYQLVIGHPFIPLTGEKDRYTLLRVLAREHASQILNQTGRRIHWPGGQEHLRVVTSWTEDTTSKLCLGRGGFGVFCIGYAFHRKKYVGIKITEGGHEVEAELEMQRSLQGLPHIMQSQDCCRAVDPKGRVLLYQVMDLAGLGSVARLRQTIQGLADESFKEQLHFHLATGLLRGLRAMHSRGRYQLDVKPDNLVVDREGTVLLIDFGCSKEGRNGQISGLYSKGDYNYFSPERWMASFTIGDLCDGEKVDAWAAGMTLLELMRPEQHLLDCDEIDSILSFEQGSKVKAFRGYVEGRLESIPALKNPSPDTLWAVIRRLLAFDPSRRVSAEQALKLPWFVQMEQKAAHKAEILGLLREMVQALPIEEGSTSRGLYSRRSMLPQASISEHRVGGALSPQDLPLPHFTNYVSRVDLERPLKQRLLSNTSFTACQGIPGIGKTQLVTYLLHDSEVRDHFGLKLWFRSADQAAQIEVQYIVLAQELGLVDEKATFKEAFPRVLRFLDSYQKRFGKPWLVVFDNADDPRVLRPYLPRGGHILATTRSKEWEETVVIEKLTPTEGRLLVQKLLQQEELDAESLCKRFAYIPLGLVQSCAYIRNQSLTISAYLDLFPSSSVALERNETLYGKELPYSMAVLYQLTLKELEGTTAMRLLDSLAYLSPDSISTAFAEKMGPSEALEPLFRYALIHEEGGGSFSIHRFLQTVVHDRHHDSIALKVAMAALTASYRENPADRTERDANTSLLFHGEALIEHCDVGPPSKKSLQVPLRGVLTTVGKIDRDLAQFSQAKECHERALVIAEEVYGPNHLEVTSTLNNLGLALKDLGNAKEAKGYFERALVIAEKVCGPNHPNVATCLGNVGNALRDLGDAREAKGYFERALRIAEKVYGPDHLDVASCLNNLGVALEALGDAKGAKQCHKRALAINEKVYGSDHPTVVAQYSNLGNALKLLGDAKGAKECYEKALAVNEKVYGPDHPAVATALNNLGLALLDLGDAQGAKKCQERTLVINEKIYGPDHPDLAGSLTNVGLALIHLGDANGAQRHFERAFAITEKAYGPDHPSLATHLSNLGLALQTRGDAKGAKEHHERALLITQKVYDPDHPDVATHLISLGRVLQALGDVHGAKGRFERALAITEKAYGPDHPDLALYLISLGHALQALGDVDGAKGRFERALAITERVYGPNHPSLAAHLSNLGLALQALGDAKGAKRHFDRALAITERVHGPDHPTLATLLSNLGNALHELGDAKGAKERHERALAITEKVYGSDHPDVASCWSNVGNALDALGDAKGAKECHERALAFTERRYGPDHPALVALLSNLGNALRDLKNAKGAKDCFERALAITQKAYDFDHPTLAALLGNLGSTLQDLGDAKGAKGYLERALLIDERVYGPNHPEVATDLNNLGSVLQDLGDAQGAKERFERACAIAQDHPSMGPDHPMTRMFGANLAAIERELAHPRRGRTRGVSSTNTSMGNQEAQPLLVRDPSSPEEACCSCVIV